MTTFLYATMHSSPCIAHQLCGELLDRQEIAGKKDEEPAKAGTSVTTLQPVMLDLGMHWCGVGRAGWGGRGAGNHAPGTNRP